jgi:hypothetical protein
MVWSPSRPGRLIHPPIQCRMGFFYTNVHRKWRWQRSRSGLDTMEWRNISAPAGCQTYVLNISLRSLITILSDLDLLVINNGFLKPWFSAISTWRNKTQSWALYFTSFNISYGFVFAMSHIWPFIRVIYVLLGKELQLFHWRILGLFNNALEGQSSELRNMTWT